MSLMITVDVRCDGQDCAEWVDGGGHVNKTKVRNFIRDHRDWTRVKRDGKMIDLCPFCTGKKEKLRTHPEPWVPSIEMTVP